MSSNAQILEEREARKGTLGVSDLTGGRMSVEQQKEFFLLVKNQMKLNQYAKVFPIRGQGQEINTLDITGRVAEADTNAASTNRNISTAQKQLLGSRIKASIKMKQEFLEENIEEEGVSDSLVDGLTGQLANNLEQLLWQGNTLGASMAEATFKNDGTGSATSHVKDDYMALFNGLIELGDGALTYNGASSGNLWSILTAMLNTIDERYSDESNVSNLFFAMPSALVRNMRTNLRFLQTERGVELVLEGGKLFYQGVELVPFPQLPKNPTVVEHITVTGTTAANLSYANIPAASSNVFVLPTSLSSTALAPFIQGASDDYTVNATTASITRTATSSITSGNAVKATYKTQPQIFLTTKDNILIGLNEDFRIGFFYDNDLDTYQYVIRTRLSTELKDGNAFVKAYNVADSLLTSLSGS